MSTCGTLNLSGKKLAVKAKTGKARANTGRAKARKAKSKPIGRYCLKNCMLNKALFQGGFWTMEVEQMMMSHLILKVCLGSVNSAINFS